MEFFQYLEGEFLAWEGRADHFLDGKTLAAAYDCRVRDCGCHWRMPLVGLDDVVYAGWKDREDDIKWEEEIWVLGNGAVTG